MISLTCLMIHRIVNWKSLDSWWSSEKSNRNDDTDLSSALLMIREVVSRQASQNWGRERTHLTKLPQSSSLLLFVSSIMRQDSSVWKEILKRVLGGCFWAESRKQEERKALLCPQETAAKTTSPHSSTSLSSSFISESLWSVMKERWMNNSAAFYVSLITQDAQTH